MTAATTTKEDQIEFVPIFPEVAAIGGVKLTDAAVFGAVWFYSYKGKKTFCQAPKTTGDLIGCSANTVRLALKKLCELGLIEDLTPDRRNSPHDYKPIWLPKTGNQKQVTKDEQPEEGYLKQVTGLPKIGNQKPDRLPKIGNEKKVLNNSNNNSTNSYELVADAAAILENPKDHPVKTIKATKFTKSQYEQLLELEQANSPRKTLVNYIKAKLTPKPPAVEVYRSIAKIYPEQCLWDDIKATIGDNPSDLEMWRKIVKSYIGFGWNKRNIAIMLDYFSRRELPQFQHGQNGATNGTKTKTTLSGEKAERYRQIDQGGVTEAAGA